MMRYRLAGFVILVLGVVAISRAGETKVSLPTEAMDALVKADVKTIQDALEMKELDKKALRKIRGSAFFIAIAAQATGKGAQNEKELASLRNLAIKVLKAVDEKKFDEAKQIAGELAKPKVDPAAKIDAVAFDKLLDFDSVMHLFSSERIGGYGIEKGLDDLVESKGTLSASDLEKLTLMAYRAGLVGFICDAYSSDKNEGGKKTLKNWQSFGEQFRKEAFSVAEAAKAKNAAGARKGLEGLIKSCTACHDVFK